MANDYYQKHEKDSERKHVKDTKILLKKKKKKKDLRKISQYN